MTSLDNYSPKTADIMAAQQQVWNEDFRETNTFANFGSPGKSASALSKREADTSTLSNRIPSETGITDIKDADLNSPSFKQLALKMTPIQLLSEVLTSDQLRCNNEDQVVDFIREYTSTRSDAVGSIPAFLKAIRDDHVTSECLIKLSQDPKFAGLDHMLKIMTKRLARDGNVKSKSSD